MTTVEWSDRGVEQIEDLEHDIQDRILTKLDEATEWTEHRLEPLTNYPYYKLRAGDYRIIIDWKRDADVLRVLAVGHRKNVYDRNL
ncbi:cytotoxic translational repressor of toxin-antitoxin stability system [Haladaptatus sp. W1]|uniref:type II toxin-antitoxin system RelE family toxin n=1 Tax=Haladaptatus sp. W1 TaxID=1897478 RepID=UPI000849DF8C|nr:type II toxin-antitoxin system RelE/ParE family toxin [Haladaptatus sp. W1]ODR80071.1 cytotoxic translational repressor of toxin-antitoxin stability system [Haladaptatus sp. W1]